MFYPSHVYLSTLHLVLSIVVAVNAVLSMGEFLVLNRSVKLPFNQSVKTSCVSRVTNYQLKGF